ncbi:DNA translocase FtsK [Bacillus sp. ISL-78]|nr:MULTISPECIES: DNA translocase FtsK [unclassified Bacillus (in: firmicutes)]MBT2617856.1 DNA translocase FtsK [Bacillus sp. ISL-78]MBT2631133.1 DNA translocase FtsK [Bacillus sp. ISL-101]MBT2716215.1 DNA translocase FtsK [Bacillus sp. ISL-57]
MDFSKLTKSKKEEIKVYNQKVEKMSQTPDPDTKILFQYPKGQFKFPLIPDREQIKRKPRERNREDNEPKQGKNVTKETTRRPVRDPQPKRKSFDREETSKIVPSNTPFRPTEIPSPIYGFRRPEKKIVPSEEIVEYELESKMPILKKEEPAIEIPVSIPEIPKGASHEEMMTEPAILIPEQAEEKREDTEIPAFFRRNSIESLPEDAVIEPNMIEPKVEKEAIEQDQVDFGREVAVSIIEQADDTRPEAISVQGEATGQSSVSQGTMPESDSSEAMPEVQPKSPKKHIPFNVMMLKQDREKNGFMNKMIAEKKSLKSERAVVSPDKRAMDDAVQTEAGQAEPSAIPERKPDVGRVMPKGENPDITPAFSDTEAAAEPENTIESIIGSDPKPLLEQESPISGDGYQEAVLTETAESGQGNALEVFDSVEADDNPYYVFPNIELLTPPTYAVHDDEWLGEQTVLLDQTLKNFNVRAKVVNVTQGPAVTRFEVHPEPGVKVNKVTNLMDDIKLSLAAQDMRMEAPIPGKHTIGIEIPNRKSKPVFLREVLESTEFQEHESPLAVALGLDISGQPIITDLRKMPHGLIAGQTGSGKSVCINTMLVSLLYKATPQELKLLLIDPKMVELAPYNRIPHLVSPVITDVKAATAALKWAVEEMERRYELFVHAGVRDITRFNEQAEKAGQYSSKLPYILVIIDELADLMMMSPADVEEAICRIAQKARACGIHLIVATQRPSVDVITGLIKANIPTRIAFSVSSQVDSRTIIDSGGAEKLLGRGDMLFAENGSSKTVRLQGTFVSDEEIDQVVNHVKREQQPKYLFEQEDLLNRAQVTEEADELFFEACEFVVSQQAASASSVQRRFRVGYNRAARLIEMMEQQGVVSESRGSRPRDVLITEEELEFLHVN